MRRGLYGRHHLRKGRFEMAHGGTLFLDEVEDIPPPRRINSSGSCRRRNLSAWGEIRRSGWISGSLRPAIGTCRRRSAGQLSGGLYYRLNVVNIRLPLLRERREDIPFLVQFFIEKYNQKYQMKVKGFPSGP